MHALQPSTPTQHTPLTLPLRRLTPLLVALAALALSAGDASSASRTVIHTPVFPAAIAPAFGSIWVITHRGGSLYRIDPRTNKVLATINVADALCFVPASGAGKLWVSGCDEGNGSLNGFTYEVDPTTDHVVGRIPGQDPSFGDGSVWTAHEKSVYRIDPVSRLVLAKIPVPGANPQSVSGWTIGGIAYGSVWATTDTTAVRISTTTDTVTNVIPLPDIGNAVFATGYIGPSPIATADGKVWLVQYPGLYQIDPLTSIAQATAVHVGPFDQWGDASIVANDGSLWLRTTDSQVVRVNPATATVLQRYPAAGAGGGVAVASGSLWVVNAGSDTVWREPLG
jgi:glutamine cyclotransferase